MSETTFFKTVFTPDYHEMITVAQASRRYHFTLAQRSVWLFLVLIYGAVLFAVFYFDRAIIDAARPHVAPVIAPWMPIVVAAVIGGLYTWLMSAWLAPRLSGRWIERRSPSRPVSLSADADYISWYSEDRGVWLKWSAIERVYVTQNSIAFLVGGVSHYVPKRSFTDAETRRRFLREAVERLTTAAQRRSRQDRAIRAVMK
jgi:hypothetical protein